MFEQLDIFSEEVYQKPKLFKKERDMHRKGALIYVLENYCVGEENKKKAEELMPLINDRLMRYDMMIENDAEIRRLVRDLRNSEIYMRVIGSTTTGIWLACKSDELDPNAYLKSRVLTAIETYIRNGGNLDAIYKEANDLKMKKFPVDNQTRHQFNTESTLIKRYSDDLKKAGVEA